MSLRPLASTCAISLLLAFPGVASAQLAQTPTIPEEGAGLGEAPPGADGGDTTPPPPEDPALGEGGDEGEGSGGGDGGEDGGSAEDEGSASSAGGSGDRASSTELAATGGDPRLVLLTGLSLTLVGAGLRLRTADVDRDD